MKFEEYPIDTNVNDTDVILIDNSENGTRQIELKDLLSTDSIKDN